MLKIGDIVELKIGMTVYHKIPDHFIYSNKIGTYTTSDATIAIGENRNGLDLSYLEGKYVIFNIDKIRDQDGRLCNKYICEKLLSNDYDEKFIVSFFESENFTASIQGLIPIGKAKATWKIE